jgi:hypothetical protein
MLYLLLERLSLLQSQAVRLGYNRNDIHHLAQLFHHNDVNRAQRMPSRTDKVEATVDTRVLDVPVAHSRQLLAQIRAVLVLDVLDDGIPATTNLHNKSHHKTCHLPVFVVHLVTVTRSVDNVQAKLDTIFNDNYPPRQYNRESTSSEKNTPCEAV